MNTTLQKALRWGLPAIALAAAPLLAAAPASANPIYIAYSLNGGPITQVGNSGTDGTASSNGTISIGNGFAIQVQGTGSPFYANGTLFSNSTSISSTGAGTIVLYVAQGAITGNFESFTTGFSNDSQSTTSVIEATYLSNGSSPSTQFALSMLNVTPGMPTTTQTVAAPAGLASTFSELETYTVTYGSSGGTVSSTLTLTGKLAAVPEPASIALLGAGLVGLVGFTRRRNRGGAATA